MVKAPRSFADKLKGKSAAKDSKHVRVIRSVKDPASGAIRFLDKIVKVPMEGNLDEHLRELLEESSPGA